MKALKETCRLCACHRFRSDWRKIISKKMPAVHYESLSRKRAGFMVSTRYCMTSVTNEIAFQSYGQGEIDGYKFGSMLEW